MAQRAQVDAYLVRAAGLDLHFQKRVSGPLLKDAVRRQGLPSSSIMNGHTRPNRCMARNIEVDLAAHSRNLSMDQSEVLLFHSSILEGAGESGVRFVVLCN